MEILKEKISAINEINDYVGIYFSKEYVQRNILNMTDEQITEMQSQIDKEKPLESDDSEF
jgi:uncharacterized protein YvpB